LLNAVESFLFRNSRRTITNYTCIPIPFVAVICWYYHNWDLSNAVETNEKLTEQPTNTHCSPTLTTQYFLVLRVLSCLQILVIKLQSAKVCYLHTTCQTSNC